MKDERFAPVQYCIGQVRSLCYLLDEPTTALTIETDQQTIMAHAAGQIAKDLRALPRSTTICVMLHYVSSDCPQVIAFAILPS